MQFLTHIAALELGFIFGIFAGMWLAKEYRDAARQAMLEAYRKDEIAEAKLEDAAEAYAAAARAEQRAKRH